MRKFIIAVLLLSGCAQIQTQQFLAERDAAVKECEPFKAIARYKFVECGEQKMMPIQLKYNDPDIDLSRVTFGKLKILAKKFDNGEMGLDEYTSAAMQIYSEESTQRQQRDIPRQQLRMQQQAIAQQQTQAAFVNAAAIMQMTQPQPMPFPQQTHCTTRYIGNQARTDCY